MTIYFASAEFENPRGRYRIARGWTSAEARDRGAPKILKPMGDDEWSDYEEWEAFAWEWPHIRVVIT